MKTAEAVRLVDLEVRAGFSSAQEIVSSVVAALGTDGQEKSKIEKSVTRLTNERLEQHKEVERCWIDATDCDRLDWVFAYLEKTGIAARQNYWCCQTCGTSAIAFASREAVARGKPYVGFIYYHEQDLENALDTGYLRLTYGIQDGLALDDEDAIGCNGEVIFTGSANGAQTGGAGNISGTDDKAETEDSDDDLNIHRVGARFVKAAALAGLDVRWSGDIDERIRIKMNWHRRRFTPTGKFEPGNAPNLSSDLHKALGPDDDTGIQYTPLTAKQQQDKEKWRQLQKEREKETKERLAQTRPASGKYCQTCKSELIIHPGRYGDYLICTDCKTPVEPPNDTPTTGLECPRTGCGGQIVEKKSKRGKVFYGCSKILENQCPSAYWYPPLLSGGPDGGNRCPQCQNLLIYKALNRGDEVVCSEKTCDFAQLVTGSEKHV